MARDARLALHELIGLELFGLVGVAGFAGAQRRGGRHGLGCDFAMAGGALDTIRAMRAGLPFGVLRLVAVNAGFSGRDRRMALLRGLGSLGHGGLDGSSDNKQDETNGAK